MASRKSEYDIKYQKENMKRVPLNVRKEWYTDVLKAAADAVGLPVNTFIKEAIEEKIARDGLLAARDDDPEEIPPAL